MYKLLSVILASIIAFTVSIGIPVYIEETGHNTVIAEIAPFIVSEKRETKIKFDTQSVNTVEIKLESPSSAEIIIYNDNDIIYKRTSSDAYRFCAFRTVESDGLTVEINGNASVESITVSMKTSDDKNFRVTSYFVSQNIANPESINPKVFDVVTDAILFGCVTFDENAIITVDTDLLIPALRNLRDSISDRDVNVYINILGPKTDAGISDWYEQMENQAKKHSEAFKTRKLEKQISELLDEYSLDGIFFDYEYPIDIKYWNDFSRFLVRLNKETEKKIGLAVAHWDIGISQT